MRKAQIIMGTGVTVDIPATKDSRIFSEVFDYLKKLDRDFSPYKKDSLVSRYTRGELKWWQQNRDFRRVVKGCRDAEAATKGAFSAYASGHFDPSGYVKGWSIEQASKIIEKASYPTYCISIGGDIKAAGEKIWKVGVQDPKNKNQSLVTLNLKNKAVATSGNYIRGQHIINPKTGKPANEIAAITVVGPNIIDADVLATAGFVLGNFGLNFIGGAKGYEALTIGKNGLLEATSGFQDYVAD